MIQPVLISLVAILALGVGAQWISWRLHLPSIVLLLIVGFLMGPVFGWIDSEKLFGDLLFPVVSLSVAIILFEGGMSLKFSELKKSAKIIRNLVTIGIIVTWLLGSLGAWLILGLSKNFALLLGSILVVTGPTVIVPLIRSLHLTGRVGHAIKWEAMVNDPVGALLSVLVFEAILAGGVQQATGHVVAGLMRTVFFGGALGVGSGFLLVFLLKRYLIPDFLQSPVTLMIVLVTFGFSNYFQAESGLLAVTLMGIVIANQKDVEIAHIAEFKENLRVLIISSLFIVLAARLEPKYFMHIGWSSVFFLFFLILIVRPLSVFISTWGSEISFREKIFLSWMAPRGIVAAAVSSVFSLYLEKAGYPQAERIVALTFLVIIVTVLVYGLSGAWMAKLTQVAQPNPQGVLMLGAHPWARALAKVIQSDGFRVVLVDSNWFNVRSAQAAGLKAFNGNAISKDFTAELDLDGVGRFLALTPNDEVNSLAAIHFAEIFGRSQIFQLPPAKSTFVESSAIDIKLLGRNLFDGQATFEKITHWFQSGADFKKIRVTKGMTYEAFKDQYPDTAIVLFVVTETKQLKMVSSENAPNFQEGHTLIVLMKQ